MYVARNLVTNAERLALSLLPTRIEDREPIWRETAQFYLTAVILYQLNIGSTFIETIKALQNNSIGDLLNEIMESENESAKMFANKLCGTDVKVIANIGIDIAKLTIFATDTRVMSVINCENKTSIVDWNLLNSSKTPFDVIIQIPEERLEQWAPLTTLILDQLINTLTRRDNQDDKSAATLPKVLIMLDEFGNLGKIPSIEKGLASLRSRGVTFALFVQSLSQIDKIYGKDAHKLFIDCCPYKVILNVEDVYEQEYFSKLFGTMTVDKLSRSLSFDPFGNIVGYCQTYNKGREPIIYPEEFSKLKDELLVISPEGNFIIYKAPYFKWINQIDSQLLYQTLSQLSPQQLSRLFIQAQYQPVLFQEQLVPQTPPQVPVPVPYGYGYA